MPRRAPLIRYGVHANRTSEALRALGCSHVYHFFVLVATPEVLARGCSAVVGAQGQQAAGATGGATMQVEDRLNRVVISPADDAEMFVGWQDLQHILLEDGYAWTLLPLDPPSPPSPPPPSPLPPA